MKAVIRILSVLLLIVIVAVSAFMVYFAAVFPKVEEAPELSIDYTPERIENGRYLANYVYVCMDCHSDRDYSKFGHTVDFATLGKGGNLFGLREGFPGDYYAKNLTPYNLSGWTDGELFRAITAGVDNEGTSMFPIMPYTNYSQLDPEDIYDIIAYIRSLDPIAHDVPESYSAFPMNFIINTIPMVPEFTEKPEITDRVAYGQYLVTAASCADCHTPIDERGARLEGMDFAGGMEFHVPGGLVYSANITPNEQNGIGMWSEEAFMTAFRRFEDFDNPINSQTLEPGEYNTSMPWRMYSKMSDDDLKAIYAYLQTLEPVDNTMTRFVAVND
jgi:mono/diheme cytochrome c family protein